MECIEKLVGLRGLCESNDGSACIFVNDLPFGELKSWAKSATSETISGKQLFLRIRKEACRELVRDFLKKIKGLKFEKIQETFIDGDYDLEQAPISGHFWKEFYSNINDPYMSISIPSIEICAKNKGTINIKITDKTDCVTVQTVDVNCGLNPIPINYKGDFVKIEIETGEVEIYPIQTGHYCNCSYTCPCYKVTASSDTVPFRTYINCICDPRQLACQYADELKYALRLRIMASLMEHMKYSDHKSHFLRVTQEQAASWYASIMGGVDHLTGEPVKGPKYYVELSSIISDVKPTISRCLSCGKKGLVYREF